MHGWTVSNPVVIPEGITVGKAITSLPASVTVEGLKSWLQLTGEEEDGLLEVLLLAVLNDLSSPTSYIGLPPENLTWAQRISMRGGNCVYLPRYNGTSYTTIAYDAAGEVMDADWEAAPSGYANIKLVGTRNNLVDSVDMAWSVGLTDYPQELINLAYMEAGFRREFPLGVGDRGEDIVERSAAAELVRKEWRMILDVTNYLCA